MIVGEMLTRMSNQEFIAWTIYYGRRKQETQLAQSRRH
jgi:hypothetical protein